MIALWLIIHQFREHGKRALTFHQSGPGSTPFVAKLQRRVLSLWNELRVCEKAAIKVSFQRFFTSKKSQTAWCWLQPIRLRYQIIIFTSLWYMRKTKKTIYSTRAPFALVECPELPSHFLSNAWHAGYRFCCTYNTAWDSNQVFDFHQVNEIKCSYNFDSVELHALKSSLKCLETKGKFYSRSPVNKNTETASLTKRWMPTY